MKRWIACSTMSAMLGGIVAAWLVEDGPLWPESQSAYGQDLYGRSEGAVLAKAKTPMPAGLTEEELINIGVYESASKGVVNIDTRLVSYDRFFMMPVPGGQGSGSGSVLDKRGHILTNNHVVEGANEIQVTLPGGKAYPAELVGTDAQQDIAVLKIDAPSEELFPIPLGASDNLKVGQRVYTLGNPFGLEGTLTTGIVSALNRTLPSRVSGREMKAIIQTDAPMNPGNSGGPLLDTKGRMVGINVAIAAKAGQSAGLGFAIPINRVRQIVPELIEHGKVVRADIGITHVAETDEGLQIVRLNENGPAEQAGLRGWEWIRRRVRRGPYVETVEREDRSAADTIVAVDNQPIESASAFVEKIEALQPGDTVVLTILRQGRQQKVSVTLGSA
jgi:S1-C subfamily serine protease